MRRSHANRIREFLRTKPEGATTNDIHQAIDIPAWSVRKSLVGMVDCYIDRWVILRSARGQYSAIWCIVEVPANCPRPNKGTK